MCGISAIIKTGFTSVNHEELHLMNEKVFHRGPDGEGIYIEKNIGLGHRLLRITGAEGLDQQPMFYKDLVLTFNGEIYNYLALREELKQQGYCFKTDTDTEIILASYDKWGTKCIERFSGMWAFVLYDKQQNLIFASRDRFGIKPLHYTVLNDKLLFASEIKQFQIFSEFVPTLNHKIAYRFLAKARPDISNDTFFENVFSVPPGHNVIYKIKTEQFEIYRWYNLSFDEVRGLNFEEAIEKFHELFYDSVNSHCHVRVPLGACMSGGLDSTSIIAVAKKLNVDFSTYSSCFTENENCEIEYIDEVGSYFGLKTKKTYPAIDSLVENNLLERIIYHHDQPLFGGSYFSEYKVFESAAQDKIRVMLSGQGADEYLGGYREFFHAYLVNVLRKSYLQQYAFGIYHGLSTQNYGLSFIKELVSYGWQGLTQDMLSFSGINNSGFKDCFNNNWFRTYLNSDAPIRYKNFFDLSSEALLNYSLPHQLHSEDRNSMMHSIESRLPFLDHKLVEFTIALPVNFKIRNSITKYILRESLKGLLPGKIYRRKDKLGFPGPEESLFAKNGKYITNQFRECIEMFPAIFDPHLLKYYRSYLDGKVKYDSVFFRILSFSIWAKRFDVITGNSLFRKPIVVRL